MHKISFNERKSLNFFANSKIKKYCKISDELPMTSVMTHCGDWLNSQIRTEMKIEEFGLSLWSQRKTDPKCEMTQCSESTFKPLAGTVAQR